MAWKTAVKVYGEPQWNYNSLVFQTREEAEAYGADLFRRWIAVEKWEPHETGEAPNYQFVDGKLVPLAEGS